MWGEAGEGIKYLEWKYLYNSVSSAHPSYQPQSLAPRREFCLATSPWDIPLSCLPCTAFTSVTGCQRKILIRTNYTAVTFIFRAKLPSQVWSRSCISPVTVRWDSPLITGAAQLSSLSAILTDFSLSFPLSPSLPLSPLSALLHSLFRWKFLHWNLSWAAHWTFSSILLDFKKILSN